MDDCAQHKLGVFVIHHTLHFVFVVSVKIKAINFPKDFKKLPSDGGNKSLSVINTKP